MKASIQFRDEQKPLLRAKIPLTVLKFPFQSGISVGDSKELCLTLGTFFESGPSIKFSYHPNDSTKPFGLIFKTGIGPFGSPAKSPLTMSAEFNLVGNQNPRFFIHFRPNLGDFTLKKSHSSPEFVKSLNGAVWGDEGSFVNNGSLKGNGLLPAPAESKAAARVAANALIKGTELSARTTVPLRDFAMVNFRWELRFPPQGAAAAVVVMGRRGDLINLPQLAMSKIGIEHVARVDSKEKERVGPAEGNLATACLEVKKKLETIQSENGLLTKALGDLRAEIAAGKMAHRNKYSGGDVVGKGNASRKPSEAIREGRNGLKAA